MRCQECRRELDRLDNEHLLDCCGLTLHEYAIRHHQPLDLLLHPDQVGSFFQAQSVAIPKGAPSEAARATIAGLRWAGLLQEHGDVVRIPGEIRRLDLLLWVMERVADYGFRFHQTYDYGEATHRVVGRSFIQAPATNLRAPSGLQSAPEPPPPFLDALAVYLVHAAEVQAGYLLMPFAAVADARDVAERLRREHGVSCVLLDYSERPGGGLLRTHGLADASALFGLLRERLEAIPDGWGRFDSAMPTATVTKELIFDAAHFITDHPAKCSNLHGGRYLLQVQVSGRIDPATGCVVDYGYLKRVVNQLIVERFDHHTLNYAAPELAWRSSTEMVCVYVWEQLIAYLPGLSGLRLYETTQSWCDYRGPTLEQVQAAGSSVLLHAFDQVDAEGRRRILAEPSARRLRAVGVQ
jgi:6-pyruvoyl tetrahydropterin synthase/QueD family protein